MFKSDKKLMVLEYNDYTRKDGRVVEQIILGDVERCIRYTFSLPVGMPKPKKGSLVEISIDLKEYQGRLYPVLSKVE